MKVSARLLAGVPLLLAPLALLCAPLLGGGCSFRRMAADQTAEILKQAMPAFEREWDFELAAAALPANVKMIEGFLQSSPQNPELLLLAAQGYTSYALLLLEDSLEQAEEDSPRAEALARRTREMYLRGHRYGLRLLERRHPGISAALTQAKGDVSQLLKRCQAADVPGLFWAGMPLSGAINVSRDDVTMISMMPVARALIGRALELDEGYYHATGHLVFGSLLGSMGPMLGGDPEAAKKHFERALELTRRRFLLIQVMYARTLAVQLQDRKLFGKLLDEVIGADLDVFPEQKLANVAAKRRARRLLQRASELF